MSTVIYPSPIFGPVHSRRLGISLGINLQPADGKVCTFDCIYCECGFNKDRRPTLPRPSRQLVAQKLEEQLQKMVADKQLPDVLTLPAMANPPVIPISLRLSTIPSVCATSTVLRQRSVYSVTPR